METVVSQTHTICKEHGQNNSRVPLLTLHLTFNISKTSPFSQPPTSVTKYAFPQRKSTSTALLSEKPKRRNWGKGCVTVNISVWRMMTMELQRRLAMGFQISKPYLFLTLNELALSVFLVLVESLASSGISTLVIVVYEHVLATIVLSLLSFFFEK